MANSDPTAGLGKRERQIMNALYERGRASVAEILADLPDPPSYSAVRAMLRYLKDKGHVRYEQEGPRYVYLPVAAKTTVRKSALGHVVRTFFGGSESAAVAALLESKPLSREEHDKLSRLLDAARPRSEK
ncbi:MAG TPA: BlaI/MecI/CopY family transcriptional regulator [Sphingomicrobium sp.]|jgi:predicted transcriptional regulator|nr:BlaI/MecI/CopY family transcriptional regulator [Sphingomicrobium sp.]